MTAKIYQFESPNGHPKSVKTSAYRRFHNKWLKWRRYKRVRFNLFLLAIVAYLMEFYFLSGMMFAYGAIAKTLVKIDEEPETEIDEEETE